MKRNCDIPEDEVKKKTDFFWDHCMPETEQEVQASIREKVFRRIEEGERIVSQPAVKKKNFRVYFSITASIAASVAILFYITDLFKHVSSQAEMRQVFAMMDSLPLEETDEVVLVMPDLERLRLETDEQVAYTPDGNMSVGSESVLPKREQQESKQEVYDHLIVPKGKRSRLLLSDGTKVWVNSGTKVVYPRVFSEKKREIYVDGEVYLEVTPDANRPFYVNTDGFEVKVLGTAFDVCAYKKMAVSKVVLVHGAVEIKDQQDRQMRMDPGELVSLEENSITGKTTVNANDYKAWVDGMLVLDGLDLRQLMERLSLLYGTTIICDSSLAGESVYGKLDLRDNLEEILDYIKSMIPLSAREENGVVYLSREK